MITGIYTITNVWSGRVYVGSSIDVHKRWKEHKYNLKEGKHHNHHLQRVYNKYGKSTFRYSVLEECSEDVLLDRERYHESLFKDTYNMAPISENSPVVSPKTYTCLSPKGELITVTNAAKFCREHGIKSPGNFNQMLRGFRESCNGYKSTCFTTKKRTVTITNGKETKTVKILAFAKEQNIPYQNLYKLANGERKSCAGWRLAKPTNS